MEVKKGTQTTEYWTNLFAQIVNVFVVLYTLVFKTSFVGQDTLNALVPIGSVIAAGISQAAYTIGRSKVKAAAHTATTPPSVTYVGGASTGGLDG